MFNMLSWKGGGGGGGTSYVFIAIHRVFSTDGRVYNLLTYTCQLAEGEGVVNSMTMPDMFQIQNTFAPLELKWSIAD